ncbi:hypothetical protein BMF94_2896 [Rhodotorula taiwanensis]|uniref:Phospholipase D1 n=1 Tax=Rhodotorula taiwanensis TaxID=741276 RepID=A0A2S5BBD9_9BASI|nr:hypothetical protein BMF94_2896 [Rhodotorula taiwanensis]
MDFQDAVFKALEEKKKQEGAGDASATSTATPKANGHPNGHANGHANGLKLDDSSQSTPSSGATAGATSAGSADEATPPTTLASSSSSKVLNGTDATGTAAHAPQLQLPINLGYMFPTSAGPNVNRSRPGSRSPSESRSPNRRGNDADYSQMLPPIAAHHLPPSSPTAGTSTTSMSALGLDTPRPKVKSQASYAWFADQQQQKPEARAKQSRREYSQSPAGRQQQGTGASDGASAGETNRQQPRSTHTSRQPSQASFVDGHGKGDRPQPNGDSQANGTSNGSADKDEDPSHGQDATGPKRPPARKEGNGGSQTVDDSTQPGSTSDLRGAFTLEDLERGARRLKGEEPDAPVGQTAGGAGKDGTFKDKSGPSAAAAILRSPRKALGPFLHRTSSSDDNGHGSGGASRRQDGGPSQPVSGTTTPARAQSFQTAENGTDWADEERDHFDTDAQPRPTGQPAASRRGSAFPFPFAAPGHHRPSESGTSTPRNDRDLGSISEDEAGHSSGGGPGAKRPASSARRGSAWSAVRNKLIDGKGGKKKKDKQGASLTGHELVSELATGALPLAIVKMGTMDRDDKGDKRIPVLMNYLKLRITDSIYPLHDRHAVFRIELEYGDAAVKWVIYRELKDFVNLHTHYRVANLRQGIDKFPAFPKTSLPYLNWLKKEGKENVKKSEFARMQREALENYLLKLIKATMFGPGANRLCKFLEISAMSIMLASRGGEQGKQGYLRITSSGASRRRPPGFHPLSWKKRHDPKWFLVRDSYIVAVESPASTEVFDVVMVDSTFELERPARALRKGLSLFHQNSSNDSVPDMDGTTGDLKPAKVQGHRGAGDPNDPSTTNAALSHDEEELRNTSAHTFYLRTSERKMRLVAKTERQQDQFIASIERMLAKTIWAGKNRFDSFAPIRLNVAAQWLIDGRDYYWSLSRAIALAKHKIFIHDWWLSPELYLRRPPALNEKWRLDRLLQRKAREGVEIFVIVYNEVSDDFTPVSSAHAKASLRALHPNIHFQRSPSHVATGTLLWSHHEKMCVIDETIGFMGGLDLCFGRWDTPGHVLIDDGPPLADSPDAKTLSPEELARGQIWPGKDYSNQRVTDFHTLTKPFEDMYDRSKVPRQPWHDIGLQIIGQPARDLCRHFIQRWNYLLRTKNHTVKMPFLVPAPDFTPEQLQELRITGTCEVQICRSVSPWSIGISHVEHSIQNAYIKCIQLSDHFVYIENQFFITSTEVEGAVVTNKIGDALVSRIVRAHSEGTPWRAIIVIPMEPGYPNPLDSSDGSSVRLIMECQFRSICRGEGSIFARLRHEGIDPNEYISFFGLRAWGTLSTGALTTESTYIHAKAMIVDDRIAIIGSANINERSQRGDRDSELACVVRDTDMIDSTMGGLPYQVGRFAHTMRIRLMREHLGVNVDELEAEEGKEELDAREASEMKHRDEEWDPDHEQRHGATEGVKGGRTSRFIRSVIGSGAEYVGATASGVAEAGMMGMEKTGGKIKSTLVPSGSDHTDKPEGLDTSQETEADRIAAGDAGAPGFASSVVPTVEEKVMAEARSGQADADKSEIRADNKRQPATVERQRGVAVQKPLQARQQEEEKDGNFGERFLARKASTKAPTSDDPEHDEEGSATTQHNTSTDDTRKLVSQDGSGDVATDAPLDAEPSDVANADQGYHALDRPDQEGSSSKAGAGSSANGGAGHRKTEKSEGNERAVNRNDISDKIKKNLRDRGPYTVPLTAPRVDPYGFADPLVDSFYKDVWLAAAARNTQIYRKVFRCMPDDLVQTWKQYREFQVSLYSSVQLRSRSLPAPTQSWSERHQKKPKAASAPSGGDSQPSESTTGAPAGSKANDPHVNNDLDRNAFTEAKGARSHADAAEKEKKVMHDDEKHEKHSFLSPHEPHDAPPPHEGIERSRHNGHVITRRARSYTADASEGQDGATLDSKKSGRGRSGTIFGGSGNNNISNMSSQPADAAAGSEQNGNDGPDHEEGFPEEERRQMEALLEEVTGQLVVFPTRYLEAESAGGNFLFSKDRIP